MEQLQDPPFVIYVQHKSGTGPVFEVSANWIIETETASWHVKDRLVLPRSEYSVLHLPDALWVDITQECDEMNIPWKSLIIAHAGVRVGGPYYRLVKGPNGFLIEHNAWKPDDAMLYKPPVENP